MEGDIVFNGKKALVYGGLKKEERDYGGGEEQRVGDSRDVRFAQSQANGRQHCNHGDGLADCPEITKAEMAEPCL